MGHMSVPPSHDWVEPLEYVTPQDLNPRPGILTAVGVMSIIIAGISFLASLAGAFGALGMLMASGITMPPMPTPTTGPNRTVSGSGVIVYSDDAGFDDATVDELIEVFARRRSLTEPRETHLRALLQQHGQTILPVPGGKKPTGEYLDNNITSDGASGRSVYYVVGTGRIEVTDDAAMFRPRRSGELITVSAGSGGSTPSSQPVFATRRATTMMANPFGQVNSSAAVLTLAENAVSAALAVYLLIIGILVLRDARAGGKLHWIYVAIKLPLVIVAALAMFWLYSGVIAGFNNAMRSAAPPGSAPPSAAWSFGIYAVFVAVVSAAYPIALIVVLTSKSVRKFYSPVMER